MGIQRMNKRGLEFKLAFFALIALSMFVIAAGVILEQWDTQYDSGISSQYDLAEYDTLEDINTEAESQRQGISPQTTDPSTGDFEGSIFRSVFGIIANIYRPFNLVFGEGGMIGSITDRFGIPNYVRIGLVTFMGIAITFAIIAIIFRLPRRSA